MKRFLVALTVMVVVVGSAFAGKPGRGNRQPSHRSPTINRRIGGNVHINNYHARFGKRFVGGWYYPGKQHNHWTYNRYWAKYGCVCYWCPYTHSYYYWYAPAGCYYPVSYITHATPVFVNINATPTTPPFGIPDLPE